VRTRGRVLALLVAGLIGVAGCGDDGDSAPAASGADKKAAADARKKQRDAAKKKRDAERKRRSRKTEAVSFVATLESTVPAEEVASIRRRLRERDFAADGTGNDNRDPFRSYVLPQLSAERIDSPLGGGNLVVTPTELCTKARLVATSYAMRDLALIGIVVRGSQRYALFRDAKGVGHSVERGKCLGREKARIIEIGDGHVTVEIMPDAIPNAPAPVAERRSIPLYASELTVDDLDADEGPPAAGATVPAPPPVAPPPSP
jgi:Tfp pilus assembly protein PilP